MQDYHLKKSVSTRSFHERKLPGAPESCLSPSNLQEVARKLSAWEASRSNSSFLKFGAFKNHTDLKLADSKIKHNDSRKLLTGTIATPSIAGRKRANPKSKGQARKGFHPTKQTTREKTNSETQVVGKLIHQKKANKSSSKPVQSTEVSSRIKLHKSSGIERRNSIEKAERESAKKRDKSRDRSENQKSQGTLGKLRLFHSPTQASRPTLNQSSDMKKTAHLHKNKSDRIIMARAEEPRSTVEPLIEKRDSEKPPQPIAASSREPKRPQTQAVSQLETKRHHASSVENTTAKAPTLPKKQKTSSKHLSHKLKREGFSSAGVVERKKPMKLIRGTKNPQKHHPSSKSVERNEKRKSPMGQFRPKPSELVKLVTTLQQQSPQTRYSTVENGSLVSPVAEETRRLTKRNNKLIGKPLKKKNKKKQNQFLNNAINAPILLHHSQQTQFNQAATRKTLNTQQGSEVAQIHSEPLAGHRVDMVEYDIRSSASSVQDQPQPKVKEQNGGSVIEHKPFTPSQAVQEIQRRWRGFKVRQGLAAKKKKEKKLIAGLNSELIAKNPTPKERNIEKLEKISPKQKEEPIKNKNQHIDMPHHRTPNEQKQTPQRIVPEIPKLDIWPSLDNSGLIGNNHKEELSNHPNLKKPQRDKPVHLALRHKQTPHQIEKIDSKLQPEEPSQGTVGYDPQVTHTQYDNIFSEII